MYGHVKFHQVSIGREQNFHNFFNLIFLLLFNTACEFFFFSFHFFKNILNSIR